VLDHERHRRHGIFRPSGATFLVFADYCRAAIRLAALSHLPVIYVFTHDSVGVGEDGPTHEPVETIPGLRVIPNLDVIRPADPEETAGAFAAALERTDGPTLLALTRQAVPLLQSIPVEDVGAKGALKGATSPARRRRRSSSSCSRPGASFSTRSRRPRRSGRDARREHAVLRALRRQPPAYREEVLPKACRRRVSIEATVTSTWARYVGLDGGIDRFGLSASKELGSARRRPRVPPARWE
jgi:transketolase